MYYVHWVIWNIFTLKTCWQNEVKLFVNRLNTEESIIPYEYHHFDFCLSDESKSPVENLGQVVFGERIRPSPYIIEFLNNKTCEPVCKQPYKKDAPLDKKKLSMLRKGMSLNYQHHWIVDNMPVTWCYSVDDDRQRQYCSIGFPMGCYSRKSNGYNCGLSGENFNKPNAYYLVNHVDLVVTYHSGVKEEWGGNIGDDAGRIISVKVQPRSIAHP